MRLSAYQLIKSVRQPIEFFIEILDLTENSHVGWQMHGIQLWKVYKGI